MNDEIRSVRTPPHPCRPLRSCLSLPLFFFDTIATFTTSSRLDRTNSHQPGVLMGRMGCLSLGSTSSLFVLAAPYLPRPKGGAGGFSLRTRSRWPLTFLSTSAPVETDLCGAVGYSSACRAGAIYDCQDEAPQFLLLTRWPPLQRSLGNELLCRLLPTEGTPRTRMPLTR